MTEEEYKELVKKRVVSNLEWCKSTRDKADTWLQELISLLSEMG